METKYHVVVSLIPIFQDKNYSQANPNYIKILVEDDNTIPNKKVAAMHKDFKNCLSELFSEYIKVNYEWPEKELISCRKNKNIIEIIFSVKMPLINGSTKRGKLVNITEFSKIMADKYYVECLSESQRRFQ